MELGYWKVKGILEPVRHLLHFLGMAYYEKHPVNFNEYLAIAEKHKFDFPNMPYIVDGEFCLTESSAIPRYIVSKAQRGELFGYPGRDQASHQMLLGIFEDVTKCLCDIFFNSDYTSFYEKTIDWLDTKFHNLSIFLGPKPFLLEYFTYSDIMLAYLTHMLSVLQRSLGKASLLAQYGNLQHHHHRVQSLPGIREYLANDESAGNPLFPPDRIKFPLID
jgi:glutathione S-transferase